jgi:hypothetical protein
VLPCMLPYLEQTIILSTTSFMKHMQPMFGEAIRGSPQSLGLIGPEKGAAVPWERPLPNWGQIGPFLVGDLLWDSRVGLRSAFAEKK